MSSRDVAIRVNDLSKCYQVYGAPRDRLKQFVLPRISRLIGRASGPHYQEFWALKGVSFEVRRGETVGIVGRNGCGKSTLLQMICGTVHPSGGTVQTFGRIAALLELGSGFNPEFSGAENIYLNATVLGLSKAEIDARYSDIVAFADIGGFIGHPVKTYSSGMLVRLAFSVAVNADPEILIVDEALAVGDELFQRKCFSRIEAIRSRGATILFVSHAAGTVVELCDRAMLLDDGELLTLGEPKIIVGLYKKLLFAPPTTRAATRSQIRHSAQGLQLAEPDDADAQAGPGGSDSQPAGLTDNFDPGLMPSSTIEYHTRGARITLPMVRAQNGDRVNNLTRGKAYKFTYTVAFAEAAVNVRFGMLVKTLTGVELGGATTDRSGANGLPLVAAGSTMHIEYEFVCALNPGLYFLNAGVSGGVDGELGHLHRIIDACCFRVMEQAGGYATGLVDFSCQPHVSMAA